MRVLVVEDETKVAAIVRRGLERAGHAVDVAVTAAEARWAAKELAPDAILLDVMLPDGDGFAVCRELRDEGCWAPIIMLTARDAIDDRVAGLDAGADDYLTKPFAMSELAARLRAVTRRDLGERPVAIEVGGVTLDPAARRVSVGDDDIDLSPKEFALLECLMRSAGDVMTRADLLERVWDFAYDGTSNVVDVYIRYLREKLDRPYGTERIETVRGVGYRFTLRGAEVPGE
jgi:two-component system, OmpR family, response regulator